MIILDTNVVSELMRPGPDATVVDWVAGQAVTTTFPLSAKPGPFCIVYHPSLVFLTLL